VDALVGAEGMLNAAYARRIVAFAAKHRLPMMHATRRSVEGGGLMAYAADSNELYRRAALYVDSSSLTGDGS
jgi:hypothetical protein